jgi:hypothetical protein
MTGMSSHKTDEYIYRENDWTNESRRYLLSLFEWIIFFPRQKFWIEKRQNKGNPRQSSRVSLFSFQFTSFYQTIDYGGVVYESENALLEQTRLKPILKWKTKCYYQFSSHSVTWR